jgi:diguanylate cyclase (GGDEF)-like protein/PAS domain S-box-containing protein/hemerythrin-like metal-binding protein
MFRFSLKTKMSIAVSLLVTVLMAGMAFWFIVNFNKHFRENIATQQFVLISERAKDIDETILHIQQVITAEAADFATMNVTGPAQAQHTLDGDSQLLTLFDHGVLLFSTSGVLIAELPNLHRQGMNFAHRDYFKKTMETRMPYISAPFSSSKANHHPVIMFTAPVLGKNGEIISILAGSIDLMQDNFLGHNAALMIGKTGYAYIYNTERTIIFHPDMNRILKRDELPGVNKVFDKGLAGFEGTEENINSRGLRALTTVKHLKTVNWIMAANYPLEDAYAPIREATHNTIIAVLVGLLLSVMMVWWGMHLLTAPLMLLIMHIRGISEHSGTGQEIEIDSADEIEELAVSFNKMMRTITGEKEALQKLSRAVEQSASLVAITDLKGDIEYVNPRFCELTGYGFEEVIGQNPRLLNSGHTPVEFYRELWETILSGREWQGEFHNKKKNGDIFWTVVSISPIKNERGEITNFCCVQEDITERKRAEEALRESNRKLEALSITDGLTGVANRRRFDEVLAQEHARHARTGAELSLILLDIDLFKSFNDSYGHVSGDECLRQVAHVIDDCNARPADLAARYGGEEFACILPETDCYGAVAIAEKIRRGIQALAIPHKGSNVAKCVTASLGVVTAHCISNESVMDLVTQVDELLYRAKSNGRNRVEFVAEQNVALTSAGEIQGNLIQLVWKNSFCCGNQLIDSQHMSLFQISNELLEKVLSSRPSTEISAIISILIDDVRQHFHDEEIILNSVSYPGIIQHAEEHAKLLAKGLELLQQFKASTLTVGDVFQFLAYEVVMLHMLGADREFFPYISEADLAEPGPM